VIREPELIHKPTRALTTSEVLRRIPTLGVCAGTRKVRYRNRKVALQALSLARRLPTWPSDGIGSVYRCGRGCTDWHITHLPEEQAA
jgi:hypothetical protein